MWLCQRRPSPPTLSALAHGTVLRVGRRWLHNRDLPLQVEVDYAHQETTTSSKIGLPVTQDEDQQDQASIHNRSWLSSLNNGVVALLMYTLWKTIYYREEVAKWYATTRAWMTKMSALRITLATVISSSHSRQRGAFLMMAWRSIRRDRPLRGRMQRTYLPTTLRPSSSLHNVQQRACRWDARVCQASLEALARAVKL